MSELTDFLLARVADREATTKADKWNRWHAPGCGMYADSPWQECDCNATARVLAECAAHRRIIELHRPSFHAGEVDGCYTCDGLGPDGQFWPCDTLRALASIYADHADFKESWKP